MTPEQPKPNRSLSEISHLFLSSLRSKQTNGAPRPVRKPPTSDAGGAAELSREELAKVMGDGAAESAPAPVPPVIAVVGAHLNGSQRARVKQYASQLASGGRMVGLIEADALEFRLSCFQKGPAEQAAETPLESLDVRQMTEAIEEMNWDVSQWLLLLPNWRVAEVAALLGEVEQWRVLTTCDPDGVVSCYRTLKNLTNYRPRRVSLAVLDATSEVQAQGVFRKLSGVCGQFLGWTLEMEPALGSGTGVVEHPVLHCRSREKAPAGSASHWQVISSLVARSRTAHPAPPADAEVALLGEGLAESPAVEEPTAVAELVVPTLTADVPAAAPLEPVMAAQKSSDEAQVIELSDVQTSAIASAFMNHQAGQLVECSVRAPACPEARVAVNRDRRLVLVAVCQRGLSELAQVGQAYRWLVENRSLVAMALPQFAIDAHAMPGLQLLVDQADAGADALRQMFQSASVQVQAYRKLRWGGKAGLLLEAA